MAGRIHLPGRDLGGVRDPDRPGLLHAQHDHRLGGGLLPESRRGTESELSLEAWDALVADNPVLEQLDTDAEALVVNRISSPAQYAIVPIDQCYALVGLIKARWEGISGGRAIEEAVPEFFSALRERSVSAAEALR